MSVGLRHSFSFCAMKQPPDSTIIVTGIIVIVVTISSASGAPNLITCCCCRWVSISCNYVFSCSEHNKEPETINWNERSLNWINSKTSPSWPATGKHVKQTSLKDTSLWFVVAFVELIYSVVNFIDAISGLVEKAGVMHNYLMEQDLDQPPDTITVLNTLKSVLRKILNPFNFLNNLIII